MIDTDLEAGVSRVLAAGYTTGHADTWLDLLHEVLATALEERRQLRQLRGRTCGTCQHLDTVQCATPVCAVHGMLREPSDFCSDWEAIF